MSKLSIYETGWINLVFQDRSKEYGAYQLRQESTKTTLIALFIAFYIDPYTKSKKSLTKALAG